MTEFNEFDLVALTESITLSDAGHVPEDSPLRKTGRVEEGLLPGDVGTIVDVCGGGEAFIVEFLETDGCLIALPTVYPNQIRLATEDDLENDSFRKRVKV